MAKGQIRGGEGLNTKYGPDVKAKPGIGGGGIGKGKKGK